MILNKSLAAAAAVVLGLALAHVDNARHSGGQPATVPGADNSASPSPEGRGVVDGRHPGYRSAAYGSPYGDRYGGTYGTMSGSVYGSLNGDYGGGPLIYWAPGRWYPYPGFGDNRSFIPPPEGVWGR
jgi:hypothetical protein